jgi:hypothetical protein
MPRREVVGYRCHFTCAQALSFDRRSTGGLWNATTVSVECATTGSVPLLARVARPGLAASGGDG